MLHCSLSVQCAAVVLHEPVVALRTRFAVLEKLGQTSRCAARWTPQCRDGHIKVIIEERAVKFKRHPIAQVPFDAHPQRLANTWAKRRLSAA